MSIFLNWDGMSCPSCRQDTDLNIAYCGTARLTADGTEDVGSHEWSDNSVATCLCGWIGVVSDTQEPTDLYEAAACLWEAALELNATKDSPFSFEINNGCSESRTQIVALRERCDFWYRYACTKGYEKPFDCEFTPAFLELFVAVDGRLKDVTDATLKTFADEVAKT